MAVETEADETPSPPLAPLPRFAGGRIFFGWYVVAAALCAQFVAAGVQAYLPGVFLDPMRDDLGWSRSQFTIALSVGQFATAFVGFFIGSRIDRHGPRPLMLIGAAVLAGFGVDAVGLVRGDVGGNRSDFAHPAAQGVEVVRAVLVEGAAAHIQAGAPVQAPGGERLGEVEAGGGGLGLADEAVLDELADMQAVLGVAEFEVAHAGAAGCAGGVDHLAGLLDVGGEGFLAEDVFAGLERREDDLMVRGGGGGDDDGVDVLSHRVEHPAEVTEPLGVRERPERVGGPLRVDVAQGDNVVSTGDAADVALALAAHPNASNVQFSAGRGLPTARHRMPRHDGERRSGGPGGMD